MKKQKIVRVCPRCGSENIGISSVEGSSMCLDCDYNNPQKDVIPGIFLTQGTSTFLEISEKKANSLRKLMKKKTK